MTTASIATIARRYRLKTAGAGDIQCLFHAVCKLQRLITATTERIDNARDRLAMAKGILDELQARANLTKLVAVQAQARADLAALESWARIHDVVLQITSAAAAAETKAAVNCESNSEERSSVEKALPDIIASLQAGNRLHAVKLYRQARVCGIREAVDAVDRITTDMVNS